MLLSRSIRHTELYFQYIDILINRLGCGRKLNTVAYYKASHYLSLSFGLRLIYISMKKYRLHSTF